MTDTTTTGRTATSEPSDEGVDGKAEGVFSKSVVISGIRCTLSYVVFPSVP